jgi:hypothetical protein
VDRNEAVNYLKEVLSQCQELSPSSVCFENYKDTQTEGYRVYIKGTIYESDREKLRTLAKEHNLAMQEKENEVVVYKPKEPRLSLTKNI